MDIYGKKILITCGGGVGDLIMFTPALRALKGNYNCRITFLTPRNPDILQGLPYVDKVIHLQRGRFLGRYRCIPDLAKQDMIVFSDWQPQLLMLAHYLRVPFIAGIPRKGHRFTRLLNKQILHGVYDSIDYVGLTHARMLEEALDIKLTGDFTKLDVPVVQVGDKAYIDALLGEIGIQPQEPYILLSPFTGLKERNWSCHEAKKLVDAIKKKYDLPVVVLGTADKAEQAQDISRYCLAGKTNLLQLVELISRAKALITPDSGPMHIAGAIGTPVVALFSKDLPSRWAPRKNCYPIYLKYECSPCDDATAKSCKYQVRCMRDITAEMVLAEIEKIIPKAMPGGMAEDE